MKEETRNTLLAFGLSLIVILIWQWLVIEPRIDNQREQTERAQRNPIQSLENNQTPQSTQHSDANGSLVPSAPTQDPSTIDAQGLSLLPTPGAYANRKSAIASTPRIEIKTQHLTGSINLQGARIDDLLLKGYRETIAPDANNITLFSPYGTPAPFYAEFGWVSADKSVALPSAKTLWSLEQGNVLTPDTPVVLRWDNGQGLVFRKTIRLDEDYMFDVVQEVENTTETSVSLLPFGLISRHGTPEISGFYILHEGFIGVFGEEGLNESSYSTLEDEGTVHNQRSSNGWLGITDKYWAAALIPEQGVAFDSRYKYSQIAGRPAYQADYISQSLTIPPGQSVQKTVRLFAGAKEVNIVDHYEQKYAIDRFELLIDWGWFYFITRPMFSLLEFFYGLVGNFGLAILLVTVVLKIFFYPLANKSYAAMSKMKKLQPQIKKLQERYKDDKQSLQKDMMELYRKEKVNPMAGCLPILLQIPVFFALYKVLFVSIEMRHAPFFGWIQDLSAPDPTTIFNLFGLLPFTPPQFLVLGVWPLLMGITMFIQMKLNPTPPDRTQAMIFNWMPVLFTFMLASFPAGLVIYWAWNNFLSIIQQWVIMRRHGVDVDVLGNIKSTFTRDKTP